MEILQEPLVEVVIAAVIFISVLAEIKTAGFSGGGLVALLCGGLLMMSRWQEGGWQMTEMLLYVGGLALIFADLFLLMSGIAAAAGLVFMSAALYLLFGGGVVALYVLAAGIAGGLVGICFLAKHLSSSRLWNKISLSASLSKEEGYVSSAEDLSEWKGKGGIAKTVLRPAGKVEIAGRVLDAVSDGDFISEGTAVVVMRTESNRVVVVKK